MDLNTKIARILNTFENDSGSADTDYRSVYIYHDGNGKRRQVTLARGFTEDGGNLVKVVQRYVDKGGDAPALIDALESNRIGKGVLADDHEFIQALKDAHDQPAMQEAQDEVFNEEYLGPAIMWAADRGFVLPLSVAVVADSYLHSGSMKAKIMGRFPEKKPVDGGDEQDWIRAYVAARKDWLHDIGIGQTDYRMTFFQDLMKEDNWDMDCPLERDGASIC